MPKELSDISAQDIKRAYNLVIKNVNPQEDAEKFENIEKAYTILSNRENRLQYDTDKMKGW